VLFGIADGMGGHKAGEVASRAAIDTAMEVWIDGAGANPTKALRQAINAANLAVFDRAAMDVDCRGMGTTLTLASFAGAEAFVGHVGDSRAYLFTETGARQLTADHSRVMEMLRAGLLTSEQAAHHPARSMLTRSLGADPLVQIDLLRAPIEKGNVLVLCTDGLWDMVSRDDMATVVKRHPIEACEELIDLAVKRGAPDNVSAVVVKISSSAPIPTGPRRARGIFRRGA
jgi:protein phosphatase